jgi:hypothetical protein
MFPRGLKKTRLLQAFVYILLVISLPVLCFLDIVCLYEK